MLTPAALLSEITQHTQDCWRFVEDQHHLSTMRLVDSLDEQHLLEELLDTLKPPVPEACKHLHYLLFTPFRYRPAKNGSRFRKAGDRRGVLYAAETIETALHEVAFYRLLFLAESPEMKTPERPTCMTAFSFKNGPANIIDITRAPFLPNAPEWNALSNYNACQNLAEMAREAEIDAIRYASARHHGGFNWAILTCAKLANPYKDRYSQWFLKADRKGVNAWSDHPHRQTKHFPVEFFQADPRLTVLNESK